MHWIFSTFGKEPVVNPRVPGFRRASGTRPPPVIAEPASPRVIRNDGQHDTLIPSPVRQSRRDSDMNSQRASAGSSTLDTGRPRAQTAESVSSFGHNLRSLGEVAAPAPANFYARDTIHQPRRSQSLDFGSSLEPSPSWPLPEGVLNGSGSISLPSTNNASTAGLANHGHHRSNSGARRSVSIRMRASHEMVRSSSERMRTPRTSHEQLRAVSRAEHVRSPSRLSNLAELVHPLSGETLDVLPSPPVSPVESTAGPSWRTSQRDIARSPSKQDFAQAGPSILPSVSEASGGLPVDSSADGRIYPHIVVDEQHRQGSPAYSLVRDRKSSLKAPTITSKSSNLRDVDPSRVTGKASDRSLEVRKSQQALLGPRNGRTPGPGSRSGEDTTALPRYLYDQSNLEEQLAAAQLTQDSPPLSLTSTRKAVSRLATELYLASYLIFFSILGTLARLGLQWLTFYPGAPVVVTSIWPNFAGCLFLGLLAEDRRLFRQEWGSYSPETPSFEVKGRNDSVEKFSLPRRRGHRDEDLPSQVVSHGRIKTTIPLYIGLATGFCSSFTSFSSFMRDTFLTLSNNLPTPVSHPYPFNFDIPPANDTFSRNAGYTFMAVLGVIIFTVAMSISALRCGAHLAIFADPYMPTLSFHFTRRYVDPLFVVMAWGAWFGAIIMTIWPPARPAGPQSKGSWMDETWRGEALFACIFAPVGCLLRFYVSVFLNALSASFPMGTFAVNIFGTAVEGMAFDLQHVKIGGSIVGGGHVSCQVLQGVMDGFCGSLTTVSTWAAELNGLKRHHSYIYGISTVVGGVSLMLAIMGSVRWTVGWSEPVCIVSNLA